MRGSCWNPTEPITLMSSHNQCLDEQEQQQQQQVVKEERQQPLLSAATPAWGLVDGVVKNCLVDGTEAIPNSPVENSTITQTNYEYNFGNQTSHPSTSINYSSSESKIKTEPQEHPEYDSGRETLNDAEDDDLIELSPEVLVQAEISLESRESLTSGRQACKRPHSGRKMLKCPVCHYETENPDRDCFMDHLVIHCAMAQREPLVIPTSSRSEEEQPAEEENENENVVDEDLNMRVPQITPQGNVKYFRCKKCQALTLTKYDSWIHQREHMTPEKILYCKVCPFATEYKHHLEYHMRNHYGSKPFKCSKCNYTCVNKSMLNSHLKSHSSIYQYRCASCNYVTKYCHSLKVHLKRNMHEPAVVLNPDGTPNPNPIIDVNSSKRGPRSKPQTNDASNNNGTHDGSPADSPIYDGQVPTMPIYPEVTYNQFSSDDTMKMYPNKFNENPTEKPQETTQTKPFYFSSQFPEGHNFYTTPFHREILEQALKNQQAMVQNANVTFPNTPENLAAIQKNLVVIGYMKMLQDFRAQNENAQHRVSENESEETSPEHEIDHANESWSSNFEPLDLTNKSDTNSIDNDNSPSKRRRRGSRSDANVHTVDSDSESRDDCRLEMESLNDDETQRTEFEGKISVYRNGVKQIMFVCRICDIIFRNQVMFTIHMGYHGRNDPLCCNICGEKCPDHVTFFVHVTRNEH